MVKFEKKGPIGVITIDRPEAKNAVNAEVASGIEAAIDELEGDEALWVGIIASSGDVFCAGADLKAINSGQAGGLQTELVAASPASSSVSAPSPSSPRSTGPALAGGCEIVLACDLVVASEISRFGIPEVKRSLVAAAGGLFRLPRAIPRNIAMEAALTGDPISAERAYHFGLVNELVPAGTALDAAMALAERIMRERAGRRARSRGRSSTTAYTTADEDAVEDERRRHGHAVPDRRLHGGPQSLHRKARPGLEGQVTKGSHLWRTLAEINALLVQTPIHELAGLTCEEAGDGHAVMRLPDGDYVRSGHAPLHGGMIALLADVTSAMTLQGTFEMGVAIPVSVDLNVRFYGQPKQWPVTAEAFLVHKGSKIVGTECVIRDAGGRQVARTTATYMILEGFGNVGAYGRSPD